MFPYEKEDIVRRAAVEPPEWVNPFPNVSLNDLELAQKNLRVIMQDLRIAIRTLKFAEFDSINGDSHFVM